jgi:hypothetical protein
MSKGPALGAAPRERTRDADDMVELFRIREPLDGRFPKDSLCPPPHPAPRSHRTQFDRARFGQNAFVFSSKYRLPTRTSFGRS